jgi:hypothetical protein
MPRCHGFPEPAYPPLRQIMAISADAPRSLKLRTRHKPPTHRCSADMVECDHGSQDMYGIAADAGRSCSGRQCYYNNDVFPFGWAATTAAVIGTEAYLPMALPLPWGVPSSVTRRWLSADSYLRGVTPKALPLPRREHCRDGAESSTTT